MGGYTDKLRKQTGDALKPGEQLVAAVRTQPRGSSTGMAVGGVIGAAVAGRQASKSQAGAGDEGSLARSWPHGRFAVALTDKRILTFSYTAMGKAKDLTSEFPLEQITSIETDRKKISNLLRFGFVDGSAAEVECAKLEKVDDFVTAFQGVKGN